jgi:hypothetical protein
MFFLSKNTQQAVNYDEKHARRAKPKAFCSFSLNTFMELFVQSLQQRAESLLELRAGASLE